MILLVAEKIHNGQVFKSLQVPATASDSHDLDIVDGPLVMALTSVHWLPPSELNSRKESSISRQLISHVARREEFRRGVRSQDVPVHSLRHQMAVKQKSKRQQLLSSLTLFLVYCNKTTPELELDAVWTLHVGVWAWLPI